MSSYNVRSPRADEFINHAEILDTLAYAEAHKSDAALARSILEKARTNLAPAHDHGTTLTHREASVLLACEDPEVNAEIRQLARDIKQAYYGNRIVLFAPLYLSNYCVNGCLYCPTTRRTATSASQAHAGGDPRRGRRPAGHGPQAPGHRGGEDPIHNPLSYILESLETIYGTKHKNGAIRRVNANIAATTEDAYRQLKAAEIGTYILFQETYHRARYEELHPSGPKADYAWHTEAHDRAMAAGIDDVGLGVLFGLEGYAYEFAGLLMHAEHLEAVFGVGPHTISVPRVKPASDIDPDAFDNGIPDEMFEKIIALIRIAVPYTGMIISTRESQAVRAAALQLGVSQISGGSRTSVGGYGEETRPHDTEQFDVSDTRTLDEVIGWLMDEGHLPSFCTACYRAGRTGDRFIEFCKSGQIQDFCQPNALLTLGEYLCDYASPAVAEKGWKMIDTELARVPDDRRRALAADYLARVRTGERDFRF
ncbi:MAG: [FeFe] hydrogenase H-cluster radical SAM maturase HydG [Adlercreutzia equolifaciens]